MWQKTYGSGDREVNTFIFLQRKQLHTCLFQIVLKHSLQRENERMSRPPRKQRRDLREKTIQVRFPYQLGYLCVTSGLIIGRHSLFATFPPYEEAELQAVRCNNTTFQDKREETDEEEASSSLFSVYLSNSTVTFCVTGSAAPWC